MSLLLAFIIVIILLISEIVYFRIASKFNIIDQPNHRSSHTSITLRGGGIIFAVAMVFYPFFFGVEHIYFILGLIAISIVSFMDDIKPVSSRLRIVVHLIAVALMFYQLNLFGLPFYWIILALFFVIGSINAINFMDGINGITGTYALITLCSLLYVNLYIIQFVASSLIITSILSVLVFNYFNFRKRAKCFAGDVGSVTIAFIILFFILQLIIKTENFNYVLLLLLYGLDTVTTIVFRAIRKENIFDAHRSHFYQYWANERKVPHLLVSSVYSTIQLFVNIAIVFLLPSSILILCVSLVGTTMIFLVIRFLVQGSSKLLGE